LRDLVTSLQQIFPVVELSCDVPEMFWCIPISMHDGLKEGFDDILHEILIL
jgi:hypothetical protein